MRLTAQNLQMLAYFVFLRKKPPMIKQKLSDKRKERNLSQEDFAAKLGIETSNYNRRENGVTKISKKNGMPWQKF